MARFAHWHGSMFSTLLREWRLALRTLRKAPAFSVAVIATMTLGVGATVTMLTVFNSIVLRPLPFPDSERAVMLCETNVKVGDRCIASPPNVADWVRSVGALESAGVARTESVTVQTEDGSVGVPGGIATPGFFRVLRTAPALGRLFEDRDMKRGSNHVAVVTEGFWRRVLHGDPAAVGRTSLIDGRAYTIVGVLPAQTYVPDFDFVQVWRPLTTSVDDVDDRKWRGFMAIGRMAPGATLPQLSAELDTMRARLASAYPDANADWGVRIIPLRAQMVGSTRATLWMFLGATAFVLLIACANVGGLLLVRATRRRAEFALRASLGADRRHVVRQLLTESAVLSLVSGLLGLVLASWTTRAFVLVAPASIPRLDEVSIDGRVATFAVLLSMAIAVIFGLVPAQQASRTDVTAALKGGRHGSPRETRLRSALVVAEIALALMLFISAGLLMRTYTRMSDWNPGFDREGVMTSWLLAAPGKYPTVSSAADMLERARDAVASAPGIRGAGLASAPPLFNGDGSDSLSIEGGAAIDPAAAAVDWFDISPGYFEALALPITRGRSFTALDSAGAPNVAIVNQTLAKRFFGTGDPVGRRVSVKGHTSEIVGVVADMKAYRADRPTRPEIYWPIRQYPRLAAYLVFRVSSPSSGTEQIVRSRLASVDPDLQPGTFVNLNEQLSRALVTPRFNMLLFAVSAFVAIALAAVGVFGVVAYSIASRTREIGIRIALGAHPRRLVREVVSHGMVLAGIGMSLGAAGTVATGRILTTLLYGLPPGDPLTLMFAIAGFAAVAAGASYVPARRAAHVDPLTALRQD